MNRGKWRELHNDMRYGIYKAEVYERRREYTDTRFETKGKIERESKDSNGKGSRLTKQGKE